MPCKPWPGLALCPLCARAGFAAAGAHWGYEGADGPRPWGNSTPQGLRRRLAAIADRHRQPGQGATCRRSRSPGTTASRPSPITATPSSSTWCPAARSAWATTAYTLVQFHFHHPSEHTIAGKPSAMEAHFVHRSDTGKLAVLGVMMKAGSANAVFKKIVETMPRARRRAGQGRQEDRSACAAAVGARLLPLRRLAHHAALQRDGHLAAAARADRAWPRPTSTPSPSCFR